MANGTEQIREIRKVNVLEQLKKLDEQRTALLAGAKKEALDKANSAIAELATLGFHYTLAETGGRTNKKSRNTDPTKKHCEICNLDGHDGRAHRGQGKKKEKFTAAELKELGLS